MARNTGNNTRVGSVKSRTQVHNATTGQYVKRNAETGQFMSSKATPYKGVATEADGRRS